MLKKFLNGLSAGVCISLGGAVFLACESHLAGAVFFCVALASICFKGYALFTGRVGYIPENHSSDAWSRLALALLGNATATVLCGLLIRWALPQLGETAAAMCGGKLAQNAGSTLARGFFCGILMYLAVSVYRDNKTPLGILLCVPAFILSGFEHSIADMFYFGCAGVLSMKALVFILLVVAGNALGGMLLPTLGGQWKGASSHGTQS